MFALEFICIYNMEVSGKKWSVWEIHDMNIFSRIHTPSATWGYVIF
jgi:hypothetical protein